MTATSIKESECNSFTFNLTKVWCRHALTVLIVYLLGTVLTLCGIYEDALGYLTSNCVLIIITVCVITIPLVKPDTYQTYWHLPVVNGLSTAITTASCLMLNYLISRALNITTLNDIDGAPLVVQLTMLYGTSIAALGANYTVNRLAFK